jgi:hypothetical protein
VAWQAFVDDLRFAQTAQNFVEVRTLSGDKFLTCVHDVNEEEGYVSLYAPQTFGDRTTRRKVPLDHITSVVVQTDMPCPTEPE